MSVPNSWKSIAQVQVECLCVCTCVYTCVCVRACTYFEDSDDVYLPGILRQSIHHDIKSRIPTLYCSRGSHDHILRRNISGLKSKIPEVVTISTLLRSSKFSFLRLEANPYLLVPITSESKPCPCNTQ